MLRHTFIIIKLEIERNPPQAINNPNFNKKYYLFLCQKNSQIVFRKEYALQNARQMFVKLIFMKETWPRKGKKILADKT